jgi:hypothetical protein
MKIKHFQHLMELRQGSCVYGGGVGHRVTEESWLGVLVFLKKTPNGQKFGFEL